MSALVRDDARDRFATTHWTMVRAAGGSDADSQAALATLCRLYWYPLYAYARRDGHAPDAAEDLVQAFFVTLLQRESLRSAKAERGKFRAFLLVAFKHFMINEYHRAHAAKRGGGQVPESIDTQGAEARFSLEPRDDVTPEALFERRWAQAVIDRAQARVRGTFVRGGKGALFERLKDAVTTGGGDEPLASIAGALGMTDGAVRVAIHRLRRRFRDELRDEIRHTVDTPEEVDEEIRFLLAAFSAPGSQR